MTKTTKHTHKTQPVLPQDPAYRSWSKEFIKKHIGHDSALDPYLYTSKDYVLSNTMLALFEFQKEPLLGKYKSVIIDATYGIVLSKRSCRSLVDELIHDVFLFGLSFQKELAQRLKLKTYHVMSTGYYVFFSIHGYTLKYTDWTALHQMQDRICCSNNAIKFISLPIDQVSYTFTFTDCGKVIGSDLLNAISYNSVLREMCRRELTAKLGWPFIYKPTDSLLDDSLFAVSNKQALDFTFKDIWQCLASQRCERYAKTFSELLESPVFCRDYPLVSRLVSRVDYLF